MLCRSSHHSSGAGGAAAQHSTLSGLQRALLRSLKERSYGREERRAGVAGRASCSSDGKSVLQFRCWATRCISAISASSASSAISVISAINFCLSPSLCHACETEQVDRNRCGRIWRCEKFAAVPVCSVVMLASGRDHGQQLDRYIITWELSRRV